MSRQREIEESLVFAPSGHTGATNLTAGTGNYVPTSAYRFHDEGTPSTSFAARWTATTSAGYVYYTFSITGVPSNATIKTITCQADIWVNNTSRFSATNIAIYRGTSSISDAGTFATTTATNVVNLETNTEVSVSDLSNIRIRLGGTRTGSSSAYIYFWGATLTVNYSFLGTEYSVTATSSVPGITIEPAEQWIIQGRSGEVVAHATSLSDVLVTDNGSEITMTQRFPQRSKTLIPSSVYENTFATYTNLDRAYANTSSTNYAQFKLDSTTRHVSYAFDIANEIPSTATVVSITCRVKARVTNSSTSPKTARLYSGDTAMGSAYTLPSSSSSYTFNISPGTWTYEQLRNLVLRFDCAYSGSGNYYLRVYGAELTVNYTASDDYEWYYNLSNISTDHVIAIRSNSGTGVWIKGEDGWTEGTAIKVKVNGSWVDVSKVYMKKEGIWEEQTGLGAMFSPDAIYIKG